VPGPTSDSGLVVPPKSFCVENEPFPISKLKLFGHPVWFGSVNTKKSSAVMEKRLACAEGNCSQ